MGSMPDIVSCPLPCSLFPPPLAPLSASHLHYHGGGGAGLFGGGGVYMGKAEKA